MPDASTRISAEGLHHAVLSNFARLPGNPIARIWHDARGVSTVMVGIGMTMLVGFAGLMKNHRRPVESGAVGPDRKEVQPMVVIAKQEAAAFIHQASGESRGDDALIGCRGDLKRSQGMDAVGSASGEQEWRQDEGRARPHGFCDL